MAITRSLRWLLGASFVVAMAAGTLPAQQPPAIQAEVQELPKIRVRVQRLKEEPDAEKWKVETRYFNPRFRVVEEYVQPAAPSKYWIGVGCGSVSGALKAQLGIDHGVVVESLSDGEPAAKAGIEQYDVLLQFGDRRLESIEDLMAAVDASDGKPATVVLLRRGKQKKLEVTPTQRPKPRVAPSLGAEAPQVVTVYGPPQGLPQIVKLWDVRPGIRLGAAQAALPEGLIVIVTKRGDEPAEVTVKQTEKTWKVKQDKLDELPESIREHVKRFLGQAANAPPPPTAGERRLRLAVPYGAPIQAGRLYLRKTTEPQPPQPQSETDLQRQLDQTIEQLEKLRRQLRR